MSENYLRLLVVSVTLIRENESMIPSSTEISHHLPGLKKEENVSKRNNEIKKRKIRGEDWLQL